MILQAGEPYLRKRYKGLEDYFLALDVNLID